MKLDWLITLFAAALLVAVWLQLRNLRHQTRADLIYRIHQDLLDWLKRHPAVRKWIFEGAPAGTLAEKYEEWEVDDLLAFFEALGSFGKKHLVDHAIVYDLFRDFVVAPYEANAFELQRLISALRDAKRMPDLYGGVESLYLELKARMPTPLASQHPHRPFPARLAFLLNNPIRRYVDPPSRVVDLLGLTPAEAVLDFGCGPGFYTIEIATRVWRTIGVDISNEMLAKARRAASKASVSVEFLLTDGEGVAIEDESVDLILLNHVFHEIEQPDRVLREFRRILKTQGRLAILERTRVSRLGQLLPGPPVMRVSAVMEAVIRAGFLPTRIEALGGRSLLVATRSS